MAMSEKDCEAEQQFCDGALVWFRTEGTELEARVITYRPDLGGYVVAATGLDESTVIPGEQWLALPSELTSAMWGDRCLPFVPHGEFEEQN